MLIDEKKENFTVCFKCVSIFNVNVRFTKVALQNSKTEKSLNQRNLNGFCQYIHIYFTHRNRETEEIHIFTTYIFKDSNR